MKILLGDFNAKFGREDIFEPIIGQESPHQDSNDNGVRLVNFATSKNLVVKSTMFPHRNIHKYTWTSPDGKTHNQIDHVLIDRRWHSSVLDVRSLRGADCDTDNYLVIAKVRERLAVGKLFHSTINIQISNHSIQQSTFRSAIIPFNNQHSIHNHYLQHSTSYSKITRFNNRHSIQQ